MSKCNDIIREICESLDYITEEILWSYSVGIGKKWEAVIPLLSPEIGEPKIKEIITVSQVGALHLFIH